VRKTAKYSMGRAVMPLRYDLHCHSTVSDGALDPAAVVRRAAEGHVDVLALTDHDCTAGLQLAAMQARSLGMTFVPGVEISATWQGRLLHIVGLDIDESNSGLQKGLQRLRELRAGRAEEIGRKLERIGIPGCYEGACALASGAVVSRSHFARHLAGMGLVRRPQAAFQKYLGQGKRAYVPCEWAGLDQALEWIHSSGGRAVIAHPARYKMSATLFRALLGEFVDMGGEAIEVACSSHDPQAVQAMAGFARSFDLLASVGSDFHDPAAGWAQLGVMPELPEDLTPVWHDWSVPGIQRVRVSA